MTGTIPSSHAGILTSKSLAHVSTLMPDGSPQTTPVWIDFDGEYVLFNTAEGRQKARNLDRDPRIALSAHDMENPYRYIQVRGTVAEKTHEGADAHIDALAKRYLGVDTYPNRTANEQRVIYRVRPEHVQTMG